MEFVTRMMDGSVPYDPRDAGTEPKPEAPLRRDDKIEHLLRVPIFQGCSQRQLRAVAAIADVLSRPAGTVLTKTGDPGDTFFLLIDGTARVETPAGKQARIGPGEFFGEMSLLDGEPRSATVVADTPVRVMAINRRHFGKLLAEVPQLTQTILVGLSRRLRQAEQALNA